MGGRRRGGHVAVSLLLPLLQFGTAWGLLSTHSIFLLWSSNILFFNPVSCLPYNSNNNKFRLHPFQTPPQQQPQSSSIPTPITAITTNDNSIAQKRTNDTKPTSLIDQYHRPKQQDRIGIRRMFHPRPTRREWLISSSLVWGTATTAATLWTTTDPAHAAGFAGIVGRRGKSSMYVVDTRNEMIEQNKYTESVATLSSEYALLKLLPVKNPIFRTLETNIEAISTLRSGVNDDTTRNETWTKAQKSSETALTVLRLKRGQLQPVFNPEDSTELAIEKQIRGELLIEELRDELSDLVNATKALNTSWAFEKQKESLLILGCLGELLVREFPYKVPVKGKFSYLPRLLGRATVTFRIKRGNKVLGDITIIADGYMAPITAGNFIDLCLRNFYTGLPVKEMTKKFGPLATTNPQLATVNILGSYEEGFYDPLTAKLRRIPLEIVRLELGTGQPKLSYSTRGLSDTSLMGGEDASLVPSMTSKPLLKFDTPGLLAWNHPDNKPNGGSSEFFGLDDKTLPEDKRRILDGEYAPFGFIIRGYDIFLSLQPGDVIDKTVVDSFGRLNLVKIRESNFQQAAQGAELAKE